MAQCPANNVVVTDTLPTSPAGLAWSIDAGTSDAGCSIAGGVLTCTWGNLTGASQQKVVHITSPTTGGPAPVCGTVTNADAQVNFDWADGSHHSADVTNVQITVSCPTPTPTPTPTGSVKGATSPPKVMITLPPTDTSDPGAAGGTAPTYAGTVIALGLLTFAATFVIGRRRPVAETRDN